MHAQWYANESTYGPVDSDPASISLLLVLLLDNFMKTKLRSSKDEVLCMLINFVNLKSSYMMFKDATTVGGSLMVESIYNEYLPVLIHLNKSTY